MLLLWGSFLWKLNLFFRSFLFALFFLFFPLFPFLFFYKKSERWATHLTRVPMGPCVYACVLVLHKSADGPSWTIFLSFTLLSKTDPWSKLQRLKHLGIPQSTGTQGSQSAADKDWTKRFIDLQEGKHKNNLLCEHRRAMFRKKIIYRASNVIFVMLACSITELRIQRSID